MARYIFMERGERYILTGGAATSTWAKVDDVFIKDHGNGLHVQLPRRKKPLELEYHELGDLLRAVRILEREQSLVGQQLFDEEDIFTEAE